ncbi:MAG: ABC transporter transmembrane domain-containing protein, partial [Bacillota bacterium]
MSHYIKQNKILFFLTILTSIISSLGYVFIAILLQQLLDIALEKNMFQFTQMALFSFVYFAVLGFFLYLQSLFGKKVVCKIIYQMRADIFKGITHHTIVDFEKKNIADYIST